VRHIEPIGRQRPAGVDRGRVGHKPHGQPGTVAAESPHFGPHFPFGLGRQPVVRRFDVGKALPFERQLHRVVEEEFAVVGRFGFGRVKRISRRDSPGQ
jgi:hypothetical protein